MKLSRILLPVFTLTGAATILSCSWCEARGRRVSSTLPDGRSVSAIEFPLEDFERRTPEDIAATVEEIERSRLTDLNGLRFVSNCDPPKWVELRGKRRTDTRPAHVSPVAGASLRARRAQCRLSEADRFPPFLSRASLMTFDAMHELGGVIGHVMRWLFDPDAGATFCLKG